MKTWYWIAGAAVVGGGGWWLWRQHQLAADQVVVVRVDPVGPPSLANGVATETFLFTFEDGSALTGPARVNLLDIGGASNILNAVTSHYSGWSKAQIRLALGNM
jgi:hypothetical protein